MTGRGALLAALVAVLAFAAAALSTFAPGMPEGLGAACAPDLVARELCAGLAVVALLLGPTLVADEPGRPREEHAGLLAVLPGAPAALALVLAGGGSGAELLPVGALLLSCDLFASSWLRLDPQGRWGTSYAAAAAFLLAGLPVAAWALTDLAGLARAAEAFRFSPLLAARRLDGGWEQVAPACLLLVGGAAVLRLRSLRAAGATAAAVLILAAGIPLAKAAAPPPEAARVVLVVGDPREGPVADLAGVLATRGLESSRTEGLAAALPCEVQIVLLGRGPRGDAEARTWTETLRGFLRSGGRVAGTGADVLSSAGEVGTLGLVVALPDAGAILAAADLLVAPRVVLPHPAAGPEPGVAPALFRLPFPRPARSLPGRTLAFLGVLAAAFAGTALFARRRAFGPFRAGVALGSVAAVGCGLLFLPGLASGETVETRLVLEERAGPEGKTARRLELVRVERTRAGESVVPLSLAPGASWSEIRFEAASGGTLVPGPGVRLGGPGRYALLAGVSGVETQAGSGTPLRTFELRGDADRVLADLRLDPVPRVALAAEALRALLRPLPPGEVLRVEIPAEGPLAVVTHLP